MAKKKKNVGGRPAIPAEDRKKQRIVRMNDADFETIRSAAEVKDKGNTSEVIRRGALKEADKLLRAARRK